MRFIHTADWHLGRRLSGVDRTPEIAYALELLLTQAKALAVDAVLVAGDIFDLPSPPAEAERVAYRFFCQLRAAGIPAVIIAGNHDSALRIEGVAQLLSHVGVQALGRPRKAEQGGIIHLETSNGRLCIAAVPFASEKRLLKIDDLWQKDALAQRQYYKQVMTYLLEQLAQHFRADSVNVVMAHTMISGAKKSHSEVAYYTRDSYALINQMLPATAHYIALGHVHSWQLIPHAVPTYYAGSLIQVDFGEAQETKGFNLVTAIPGQPAEVEFIPIPCQKPLEVVTCQATELEAVLPQWQDHPGFLKFKVTLTAPKVGLADRIRKICPQTLMVEPCYPQPATTATPAATLPTAQWDATAAFQDYWQTSMGDTPPSSLLQAFQDLYQTFHDATS